VRHADLIALAAMEVMPFLASGKLQIIAGQTFPLAGATQAHQAIADYKSIGKEYCWYGTNPNEF